MAAFIRHIIIFFILTVLSFPLYSQEEERGTGDELLRHEYGVAGLLHVDGFGLSARNVRNITYFRKWYYEAGVITMKHPKEIKSINTFHPDARSFVFGKENYMFITRGGVGMQRILNREPFWESGLEVRIVYGVGFSLGITKPVYLYIIGPSATFYNMDLDLEKYDPNKHRIERIHGRGPFTKGFGELSAYPGAYGKLGFNFEFAGERHKIRALEAGTTLDVYPVDIPIMANVDNKKFYLSFYISMYFGARYN